MKGSVAGVDYIPLALLPWGSAGSVAGGQAGSGALWLQAVNAGMPALLSSLPTPAAVAVLSCCFATRTPPAPCCAAGGAHVLEPAVAQRAHAGPGFFVHRRAGGHGGGTGAQVCESVPVGIEGGEEVSAAAPTCEARRHAASRPALHGSGRPNNPDLANPVLPFAAAAAAASSTTLTCGRRARRPPSLRMSRGWTRQRWGGVCCIAGWAQRQGVCLPPAPPTHC